MSDEIEISCGVDKVKVRAQPCKIPGWPELDGKFAVHRDPNNIGLWNVTHIPTGKKMPPGDAPNLEAAIHFCMATLKSKEQAWGREEVLQNIASQS